MDWPHKAQSKAYFPPKGIHEMHTDSIVHHRPPKRCHLFLYCLWLWFESIAASSWVLPRDCLLQFRSLCGPSTSLYPCMLLLTIL